MMSSTLSSLKLKISEIFFSLQGESTRVGLPTVFIRLTGCPLRCVWCDTEHAFSGGKSMVLSDILDETARHQTPFVCVTGGEPLAQKNTLTLLTALCDASFNVSLETSGALDISDVDPRVSRIVDLKAPGSGEVEKNHWKNLQHLREHDELKFVLKDRADYDWAKELVLLMSYWQKFSHQAPLHALSPPLFSPVQGSLDQKELAEWILEDHLPVRFQTQLHKQLWGNVQGK